MKLNNSGDVIWQRMYGGSASDYACSVAVTSKESIIVAGYSGSNDISGCILQANSFDCYRIKLDSNGDL